MKSIEHNKIIQKLTNLQMKCQESARRGCSAKEDEAGAQGQPILGGSPEDRAKEQGQVRHLHSPTRRKEKTELKYRAWLRAEGGWFTWAQVSLVRVLGLGKVCRPLGKFCFTVLGHGQAARASTTGGSRTALSSSYTLRSPVLDPCG